MVELVDQLRAGPNDVDHARGLMTQAADKINDLVAEKTNCSNQIDLLNNDVARLRTAGEKVPAARKDLIRRLVAVAISVGFASQVVSLKVIDRWTGDGLDQVLGTELARLTTALLVILLGWDWYDRDVEDKPLTRILRFILDAIIVMAELVLLLSSDKPGLWSNVLVMVFGFYVVWDILTIVDHPSAFGFPDPRPSWQNVPTDILSTYIGGLAGDHRKRGPPINLGWLIYFLLVLRVLPFSGKYADFAICLMVALGACALWSEGVRRRNGRRLIAWWGRLLAWAALAILYYFIGYPG